MLSARFATRRMEARTLPAELPDGTGAMHSRAMMLALLLAASTFRAAPCAAAKPECTEWITLAGQQARVLIYRSFPLAIRNENITRALFFVHGINRDADNHFRTVLAAAFLAGSLDNTLIVAPRFASNGGGLGTQTGGCLDALAADEANWICDSQRADSWRSGGGAVAHDELTSFDAMDEIVRRLARKSQFPHLKTIVVAGHSAGGQFVIRYAMANRPVTYLLGESDILPLGVFDTSCSAMAQGPTRLARGLAFSRHVEDNGGASHTAIVVPFCGHSARCVFTSDVALPVLFPK